MTNPIPTLHHDQRLQLLIAAIKDYAIYLLDIDGRVSSWNAGAERIKGYTASEIIGQHFSRFHTPEDQAAGLPAHALLVAQTEGKFECEGWRVRKDGSRFWASVVIDPVHDNQGNLIGFAKITRDITDQKRSRDALYASEHRFRLLVEGVVDYAIYLLSPSGEVTNWNAGAERIKGYKAAEIIGSHFSRFYTEADREAGLPVLALATAQRTGKYEAEGWRVRKDGTQFWANVVVDAIRDDSGTLIGFAKITRDVTEKQKAAQALAHAREALFQSQKMEAIGQLTGGIAHDFNNLLSIVSSGLEIIKVQGSHVDRRVLESMHRAVERGSSLTQQLLAFARRQPLTPALHDLDKLIEGFENVLRRAVDSRITFNIDLGAGLHSVLIDEARFEAAILNLVVNARDAMPEGGTLLVATESVTLDAHERLAPGAYIRISVSDTGTGMPPDVAARVFEPFFTTKPAGKGTGLGLSQVHGFIAQSGGDIAIETAVGAGTTVSILLPAVPSEAEARTQRKDSESEKVLVVEDENDLAALAATLFESMGYEVLIANNGKEALSMLERNPDIDVLFSDVMMPQMSGIELARIVRRNHPQARIVLASGYPMPALRKQQSDIDEFAFVAKPYRLSEIIKRLR